jgi:hypothetical protein
MSKRHVVVGSGWAVVDGGADVEVLLGSCGVVVEWLLLEVMADWVFELEVELVVDLVEEEVVELVVDLVVGLVVELVVELALTLEAVVL